MLRPATPDDFPFIRALVQRPDYAIYLTDEDEAGLAAYLAEPAARLLIWDPATGSKGFALYCEVGDPSGRVELRRLALDQAGAGQGQTFVAELVRYGFDSLGAAKIWLDASSENLRAQTVYTRAGFMLEGRLRQHWYRPILGRTVDLMLYGLLRADWKTRDGQALEPNARQP
jgi:ribosomal protein S18 acetylase RimI-like enzyme